MKKQISTLLFFSLLCISIQAKMQNARNFESSQYEGYVVEGSNEVPANHYESELAKIQAEIKSKEEQAAKINQEINKLKESEVRTSALFEIAKKSSIRKTLESNPVEKANDHHYGIKKHKMQYACK